MSNDAADRVRRALGAFGDAFRAELEQRWTEALAAEYQRGRREGLEEAARECEVARDRFRDVMGCDSATLRGLVDKVRALAALTPDDDASPI